MRCVIYRRVSTDMQAEEGFSLEAQRLRLNAYAESQGWKVVEDYCDEGFSAKSLERPEMQRLIKDLEKKSFDIVLVYRLDRFVRSVLDLHELLQIMERHDVKFKSATEIFDTTSATGRLFITLIATLAQWERETIAERVYFGMTKKAELGERNGAPAPFGYDLVDGKLVPNDDLKWVKYIFERYGSVGSQSIARDLNSKGVRTKRGEVWSDFSVRYTLKNPIYAGYVRWNYETVANGQRKKTGSEIIVPYNQDDFVPAVDKATFDRVQALAASRSVMAFRSDNFYPFSGILRCEKCGYGMSGATKPKNGYRFYTCRGRFDFGICDMPAISEEVVENEMLKMLELAEAKLELEIKSPMIEMSIDDIRKQATRLKQKKERTEELYLEGEIKKDRYIKIVEQIRKDEAELYKAEDSIHDVESERVALALLNNIKVEWPSFSFEAKKKAVHLIFESITVKHVKGMGRKMDLKVTDYKLK